MMRISMQLTDKTKANKDLWQAWADLFYSPIKPISLGLEYVYGEREAFCSRNQMVVKQAQTIE